MNKSITATITISSLIVLFILLFPQAVQAGLVPCGQADAPGCQLCHIFILIRNIVTIALEILTSLVILFIVVGGIAILTSGGSPEKVSQGKRIITYSIIGIVIALSSWVIINSVIVLVVNPDIFPVPWNVSRLKCPIVKISPPIATATSYTLLNDRDNNEKASPGDTLRYSFVYTNTSGSNLSDLVITSDYDQKHIFAIINISDQGTDDSDKIIWQVGNLKSGQSVTVFYDFILATNFSDLLGKVEKPNLFTKILNKISEFFSKKALAKTQTIYLQNIVTISSNQAETETFNDPMTVIAAAQNIGDPEDIPNNPDYLAGYYEEPDDKKSKWPSYDWYFDQLANNDNNVVRLWFYNPNNPFYSVSPWINNDCGQPNDSFYTDWLRPTVHNANSKGIYVVLTLYMDDWSCNNRTQENREKTYDRIIDFLDLPQNNKVIVEINWEVTVYDRDWMQKQAEYFENKGIPTIITNHCYPAEWITEGECTDSGGATNHVSTYAGRHRNWDRATSLLYFDSGKPTIWTERHFQIPDSTEEVGITRFIARENIYALALTVGEPILFYYYRWSTPNEPWLPEEYLKEAGYAVELAKKIPWQEMVPQERYNKAVADKGYWAIKDKEAVLGWVNKESQITIDITGWSGDYNYWWFNPRNGMFNYVNSVSGTPINQTFTVSTPDSSEDWVFVLKGEKITSPSHKECSGNSCIIVSGPGADQCNTNADCAAPTLSVSLSADPSSGYAPLSGVILRADVSGIATGTINYTFYCNRPDSGTNITPGYAHKLDATNSDPYSAPAGICDSVYADSGTYTAKVIVERGDLTVEDRATITVSTPSTGADYWLWGVRSCDSTRPCQEFCDDDGADYCVRGMANCENGFFNLQILHEGETGCSTGRTGNYECSFREAGACIDVSCRCGKY